MAIDPTDITPRGDRVSKGRYVYRVGDDEAEHDLLARPARGSSSSTTPRCRRRLPRPGRRAWRWSRAPSRTPGRRARRSCRSARSRRRSSAGTPTGPTCCGSGGQGMSWNPTLDPICPDGDGGRRDRDADHPARPRPRRLRGAPGAAGAEAADGRAVHLLRPGRAGRVPDRPGHRRAAASAHRARHGHLPLPRRVPAPRQPRHRTR